MKKKKYHSYEETKQFLKHIHQEADMIITGHSFLTSPLSSLPKYCDFFYEIQISSTSWARGLQLFVSLAQKFLCSLNKRKCSTIKNLQKQMKTLSIFLLSHGNKKPLKYLPYRKQVSTSTSENQSHFKVPNLAWTNGDTQDYERLPYLKFLAKRYLKHLRLIVQHIQQKHIILM